MNHLEFLKWTGNLEKDDDILLVHILERLASHEPPCRVEPFYDSLVKHKALPKNALHIAKAYAQIQRLSGHEFNVIECAYLEPEAYKLRAILAFVIQIGFFLCLVIYNIFEDRVYVTPDEDGFYLVVLILIMSCTLFLSEIRRQYLDAKDFNEVMLRLSENYRDRRIWIWINYGVNGILGVLVFFFNIYFILVSDDPTEAVLNSVALAFIIEIDDVFKPNWNESTKEDGLAEILKHYIIEDIRVDDINVKVSGRQRVFDRDMNVYIRVGNFHPLAQNFVVNVFVSNEEVDSLTKSYESIDYTVSGTRVKELYEAFLEFHCLENLQDIVNSYAELLDDVDSFASAKPLLD